MGRVLYRDDQLNFLKFTDIVTNDFPKAMRQTFRLMWDRKFGPVLWDDSEAVRKLFRAQEGGTTDVPTHKSYEEWDCTALFQATIFAQSFALPDSTSSTGYQTLSDMYVKPVGLARGDFHASVVSSGGDYYETVALAIDQLRLLRNSVCHPVKGEMSKRTLNQHLQRVKDAFKALGLKTDKIDAISSESGFPTSEVADLERKIQNRDMAIKVGLGIGVGLL